MKIGVKVKRQHPSIAIPEYQTTGAAGFDLAAAQDYHILPRSFQLVSTGLVIVTPPGHMLMLTARSSLYKKKGLILTNSVGIVDEDYAGPDDLILLSLRNDSNDTCHIGKGERLAQGIFVPITRACFEETSRSAIQSRGGWGSTGDKTRVYDESGKLIGEQG